MSMETQLVSTFTNWSRCPNGQAIEINAWTVMDQQTQKVWLTANKKPGFASQRDCDIAIHSLASAGILCGEDIRAMSDEQFMEICCRDLLW